MTTRAFAFFLLLLLITGCAGGSRTVAISHSGGVSGIEQRYSIDTKGLILERSKLSQDTFRIVRSGAADPILTRNIFAFVARYAHELDTLKLQGTGNLTTALTLTDGSYEKILQWPNLDPPHISTGVVDSLYQMMLGVQEQIGKLPSTN